MRVNLFISIDFTNRKIQHIPINMNVQEVSYANTTKYLALTLDMSLAGKLT